MGVRKLLGHIGVDSGQVMVGDPCYLDEFKSGGFMPNVEAEQDEFSYQAACEASLSSEQGGVIGQFRGAVSNTAYGDGLYPVYQIVARDGTVEGLFVDFLSYEDEEDQEEV